MGTRISAIPAARFLFYRPSPTAFQGLVQGSEVFGVLGITRVVGYEADNNFQKVFQV
jgi:hypothetical protein